MKYRMIRPHRLRGNLKFDKGTYFDMNYVSRRKLELYLILCFSGNSDIRDYKLRQAPALLVNDVSCWMIYFGVECVRKR